MAKLLVCPHCKKPAIAPASAAFPKGEPLIVGRHQPDYKCARCKRHVSITPAAWARMPRVTQGQLDQLARQFDAPRVSALLGAPPVGERRAEWTE